MKKKIDTASEQYENKLEFFLDDLRKIKNPQIIEFGVRFGVSTKKIIDICEMNNGFLNAIDVLDCSKVSNSKNWKFHQCRDDDFEYLNKVLPRNIDLIYLDSYHNANHIEKIFYHYYDFLKPNGFFIFDDISWIPYLSNKKRNSFNCEINNLETFEKILQISSSNEDLFKLYFSFEGSGLCKIIKKSNLPLNKPQKIKKRTHTIKNYLRKVFYYFKSI